MNKNDTVSAIKKIINTTINLISMKGVLQLPPDRQHELLSDPIALTEYVKHYALTKPVELKFFQLGLDKSVYKEYVNEYDIYSETLAMLKETRNVKVLSIYHDKWSYPREQREQYLRDKVKKCLNERSYESLSYEEAGRMTRICDDWVELALEYSRDRDFYHFPGEMAFLNLSDSGKAAFEYMRARLGVKHPEISKGFLLGCLKMPNWENLVEYYLFRRRGLYGPQDTYTNNLCDSDMELFWRRLCAAIVKLGLREKDLMQYLKAYDSTNDYYWTPFDELANGWRHGKHLCRGVQPLIDDISDRYMIRDVMIFLLNYFGFSREMQMEIMKEPWGDEVMQKYVNKGHVLYFDNHSYYYDEHNHKYTDECIAERAEYMEAFKRLEHASEIMQAYMEKSHRGLESDVVVSFVGMKNWLKMAKFYICKHVKWPYYLGSDSVKQLADAAEEKSEEVLKTWLEMQEYVTREDLPIFLNRVDTEDLLPLFIEKNGSISPCHIDDFKKWPSMLALFLKRRGRWDTYLPESLLRYLKEHPDLTKTEPETDQVLDKYIVDQIAAGKFGLSYNASKMIAEVKDGKYVRPYYKAGGTLSTDALCLICDMDDAGEILTEYFSGKEQFGYSERLVAKLQEKGLNNVLDMYISKT